MSALFGMGYQFYSLGYLLSFIGAIEPELRNLSNEENQ